MEHHKTDHQKIHVLYIAGMGHSGSTLLDLVLGSGKRAYGLGELCNFPMFCERAQRGEFCDDDSGVPIYQSEFWKPIYDKRKEFISRRTVGSVKKWLAEVFLSVGKNTLNHQIQNEVFFRLIQEQAVKHKEGPFVLIDSSKNIFRLKELHENPHLEVSVIHLVRNPVATIASLERKGASWYSTLVKWVFINLALAIYTRIKFPVSRRMLLFYEDFAKDMDHSIEKINKRFGLQIDTVSYITTIDQGRSYRFSGNVMMKKKFEGVRLDEKWKTIVPWWKRILVSILTFPVRIFLKII